MQIDTQAPVNRVQKTLASAFFLSSEVCKHKQMRRVQAIAIEAIQVFLSGNYFELDALVGNAGCEVHAFNILSLAASQQLREECQRLQAIFQGTLDPFQIASSEISEEMTYLIQSRILTITKTVKLDSEGYATKDETVFRPLKMLEPENIVNLVKDAMSKTSIARLKGAIKSIPNLQKHPLLLEMFEPDNLHFEKKKTFSSCLYNTKALLLLSRMTPIVLRRFTKRGEDACQTVFCRLDPDKPYTALSQLDVQARNPMEPVLVCEAFFSLQLGRQGLIEKVSRYGLENILLASGTLCPQYSKTKPNLSHPKAIEEFNHYKALAYQCELISYSNVQPFFEVNHFFCNTLAREMSRVEEHKESKS